MQLVRDIYAAKAAQGKPVISFEVFPPKTPEGDRNLLDKTIPALMQARPDYCSVTYGAGGSTRDKTLMIVDEVQRRHQLPAVAHLTCVSATRDEIRELLEQIKKLEVRNLLALRGDPPGGGDFTPTPGGFEFAAQLVNFIREQNGFSIGVAGFPEGHVACKAGKRADWAHLGDKVRAGADFVITQLFFENADYYEFRDAMVREHGVNVPLVPGIVPILSGNQIKKFTALCGARIPAALGKRLDELGDNDAAVAEFGIEYAAAQCEDLLKQGAPGIHFYSLNKSQSTLRVLKNLGLT